MDTSWALSWWSALYAHRGFLSPPTRDADHGTGLVFAQNRVTSETRVVEQGEEN